MAKTKEQKGVIVDKLEHAFKNAASSVFVHFSKVTVAEESNMRRALKESDVSYFVAKKTLIRRALDRLGHKHADLPLEGEVAVAYVSAGASAKADGGSVDSTAPARLMHEFGKKLTDPFDKLRAGKLTILGGIFEGRLVSQDEMRGIATIPSMQVLRGMFVQLLNSPRQRFAVVLSKVAEKKN